MTDDQAARRAARSRWPVRIFRLGEEPGDDLSASTTAAERIEMVWLLSARCWELTSRPLPDYTRATIPVRLTTRP